MKKEQVYYKGTLAGEIAEESSGEISFRYNAEYLENNDLPPISVSLPKKKEPYTEAGLPPFFDGLIPEGWLLTIAAERLKVNPYRDRFALLISTCQDTIGAVTVSKVEQKGREKTNHWAVDRLQRLTEDLRKKYPRCLYCYESLNLEKEYMYHEKCSLEIFGTNAPPILDFDDEKIKELGLQTVNEKLSVPGVQKKISLSLDEAEGDGQRKYRMTVANLWARYILKPKSHPPHLPENEHLILLMARHSGIKTANTGMLPLASGELALISERFDRPKKGGKYHMEDFCQILLKRPEQKYIGSIEQVAKKLREITSSNAPQENILRLYELVLFSFLVGNSDVHLKNISVIWSPKPMLSPAYDLLCMDVWIPDDDESALSIGGKKNKLTKKDFDDLCQYMKISPKVAENIKKKMFKQIPKWFELIDKSYLEQEYQDKLKNIIESRVNRLSG